MRAAFTHARERGRTIIVESFIEGVDHRMLVVNGELIAVAKRVPGHVVGDGETTVEKLVAETNRAPRRGIGHEKVLTRLEFDHQAMRLLSQKGYHIPTSPRWRCARRRPSASTSPASTSSRPTSRSRTSRPEARSAR